MRVKVLNVFSGMPLEDGKEYKVNFETSTHYIILSCGIWCGIFKEDAEIVQDFNELDNGQLVLNI
ncbi:hypothetical protein KYB31_15600 [Clostridium felsineum]|uniref:hypothetical protein n=1 Tax=Clostridium felsineum TaxID=36839 RepID=UPI00214D152C|nr:hypothetical protein [Clostridium felsineum]MCR3760402.1 hypothetical protein [Clostridium felsineum]